MSDDVSKPSELLSYVLPSRQNLSDNGQLSPYELEMKQHNEMMSQQQLNKANPMINNQAQQPSTWFDTDL
jgi:hypothetical protein